MSLFSVVWIAFRMAQYDRLKNILSKSHFHGFSDDSVFISSCLCMDHSNAICGVILKM